jgi:hypothetical protein
MGEDPSCPYCGAPDSENIQTIVAIPDDAVEVRAVRPSVPANVMHSDFAERFLARLSGDRAHDASVLTLAKNSDFRLKYWCPRSARMKNSETNVASQMETNGEN